MKAITESELIQASQAMPGKKSLLTKEASQWALDNLAYLNRPMKLLSSSYKVEKGFKKAGITTAILYLQPADKVSTRTLCAGAKMAGCKNPCLISSGHLGMSPGQNAATKRTILYVLRQSAFTAQLLCEIQKLSAKHADNLAVRLNGTSDIDFGGIYKQVPAVQFYDYTKVYARIEANTIPNYSLTYSASAYSKASRNAAIKALKAGTKTVLAFNTKELKSEYSRPKELADYDATDLRFLPEGCTGSLTRKGSNKADRASDETIPSFFFTQSSYADLIQAVNI